MYTGTCTSTFSCWLEVPFCSQFSCGRHSTLQCPEGGKRWIHIALRFHAFSQSKEFEESWDYRARLFLAWKPLSECVCETQRGNGPWPISGVHDRANTVLLQAVTDHRRFGLSPCGARHWETTVRDGLRRQHFPKLSEYTDFAAAFCIKRWVKSFPSKRKQNQDGFEKIAFSLCRLACMIFMSSSPSCWVEAVFSHADTSLHGDSRNHVFPSRSSTKAGVHILCTCSCLLNWSTPLCFTEDLL